MAQIAVQLRIACSAGEPLNRRSFAGQSVYCTCASRITTGKPKAG